MNPMTQPTPDPRCQPATARPGHRREQGSLLILCVTVLVIIALIGIAFLQRVRMDQFATARHEQTYVNIVINGILEEVSNQMQGDVNQNISDNNLLYDYPWTKEVQENNATLIDGTVITVNGAGRSTGLGTYEPTHEDDRWLASTAPVWSANDSEYRWLHLTNLTGIWLDLPAPDAPPNFTVVEHPIDGTAGNINESDTDLALTNSATDGLYHRPSGGNYESRGADADGDGILDSAWQWAPTSVRQVGGRTYVMSLRIVDLSSMLNVNTATSLTIDGTDGTPWVARGHNPAWVDLSRLMSRMPTSYISTADWRRELTELVKLRLSFTTMDLTEFNLSGAQLFDTTRQGRVMWEEQASIYGNSDRNYQIDTELELRRFGGLNDRSQTPNLETLMGGQYSAGNQFSRALRQHPALSADGGLIGPEGSFQDVVSSNPTFNSAISAWFYGIDPGNLSEANTDDAVLVRDREYPAIRHMLTAKSGTAVYAPQLPAVGMNPSSDRFKFDLNQDWTQGTPADIAQRLDNLEEQMLPVFKRTSETLPGKYLGLSDAYIDDLVAEYVASIKDYSDPDNVPTSRALPGGGGINAYGLERLPFLREVYIQALYADVVGDTSDRAPWDPANDGSVGTNYVGWTPDVAEVGGKTYAMAIELGNPFNHTIYGFDPDPVKGLDGRIQIRVMQGGAMIGFWEFDNTTPDIGPRDDSTDDDTLIVYSPPQDSRDTSLNPVPSDMPGELNFSPAKGLEITPDALTNGFTPGGGDIVIELYVLTDLGTFVKYDQMELDPGASLPANIDHAPNATAEHKFAQASSARDSEDINFIVDDGPGGADLVTNLPNPGGNFDGNLHRFDTDNKGTGIAVVASFDFYRQLQLHLTDEPMRSVAELGMMHMFGFTDTEHFSRRMSANTGPPENEHFLLIDPDDPGYDVVETYAVPHAALLMDLFTTVSPRGDNRDNDNDDGNNELDQDLASIDNEEELLVPGTLNVNTMPMHLMTLASPLGESLDEVEKLMRTIVAYRDEPLRGARLRLPADSHGQYWSTTTAGFDVQDIRRNALNPNYHLPQFPITFPSDRLNQPGIASLGELLYLNPGSPDNDMLRYGIDGTPGLPGGNGGMDIHPDPNEADANSPTVPDDNEQRLARFGMLSQAYTVRSDRYVIYGVVRGYDSQDLTGSASETARFIAIIDRGAMFNPNPPDVDKPRVIGFERLQ